MGVYKAKNLKKRRTFINGQTGEVLKREGFTNESKKEALLRKQQERAKRLGLK